jgi:hypothetical protein
MLITSAYITELTKLGIDWGRLRDDNVSGMTRYDIAQAAYLYLLENPEKSASYAVAAVVADARRRAVMEHPLPDDLAELAASDDDHEISERHDIPADVEVAASILRGGTDAAAAVLGCSRRRVQQLLARDPVALAQRIAAASRQRELFCEGA